MKINPIAACFLVFCINAIFIFFGVSLRRSSLRRAIRCNLLFVPHKRIFASIPHAKHTQINEKSRLENQTRFLFQETYQVFKT